MNYLPSLEKRCVSIFIINQFFVFFAVLLEYNTQAGIFEDISAHSYALCEFILCYIQFGLVYILLMLISFCPFSI